MKKISIVLLALFIGSCCNTKQLAKNTTIKEKQEVAELITPKTPKPAEIPKTPETPETPETPIIVDTVKAKKPIKTQPKTTIVASTEAFNHEPWNKLLQKQVSNTGNVNYSNIKSSRKALTNYIASLGNNMPNNTWTREDKLAYWINAYNAMTIDLIVRNYPVKSIKDIKDPWGQRLWKLGEKWYNLNEIEHDILRKMNEPRIHFAIVCASFSCPKLKNKAYTASTLNNQLTNATKDFLSDTKRNTISENTIKISKIFKWFSKDFETEGSLINFINTYSKVTISNKAKRSFKNYNWGLNE